MKKILPLFLSALLLTNCSGRTEQDKGQFRLVNQKNGPALGYSPSSGVTILSVEGKAFKDLNRNGTLDPYEDWRLSPQERAADLAGRPSCGRSAFQRL